MKKLLIFTDGGAIDNPGPAAVGVVVKDERGKLLTSFGEFIGTTTNNVAEYQAVIEALKWLTNNLTIQQFNHLTIDFFLDSKLVVNQLNGLFKIKNARLRLLMLQVRQLEQALSGHVVYQHIPREKNFLADEEVKKTLRQFSKKI